MAMSTGWTLDHVGDNVDLPRLASLTKYWAAHPPTHILMAWYTGYKAPEVLKPKSEEEQALMMAELMANAPKYEFKPPVARSHGN